MKRMTIGRCVYLRVGLLSLDRAVDFEEQDTRRVVGLLDGIEARSPGSCTLARALASVAPRKAST